MVVCQKSRKKWLFDVFVGIRWNFFVRSLADSARISLILRLNYVIIRLKSWRSVLSKEIWEIPNLKDGRQLRYI